MTSTAHPTAPDSAATSDDPYLWLEDIDGDRAMAWVTERNERTLHHLEADPRYHEMYEKYYAALSRDDRIPAPLLRGDGFVYNFWTDATHERGLWRRATWESYHSDTTEWDVLLDLDALCEAEGTSWVWRGAQVRRSDYARALLTLSEGGSDASTTREFCLTTRRFVPESEGGFVRPAGKGDAAWDGDDAFLVQCDRGEGTMSEAGYPTTIARVERGTPCTDAVEERHASAGAFALWTGSDHTAESDYLFVVDMRSFHDQDRYLRTPDGTYHHIDAPTSAEVYPDGEWVAATTYDDAPFAGTVYAPGTLLIASVADITQGKAPAWHVLFTPSATTSLGSHSHVNGCHVVVESEHVAHRVYVHRQDEQGQWQRREIDLSAVTPARDGEEPLAAINVAAVDSDKRTDVWMTVDTYTVPSALYRLDVANPTAEPVVVKTSPTLFDGESMVVERHFATSKDGTKVPYLTVAPREIAEPGLTPVSLYGYGGFNIHSPISYATRAGIGLVEHGGIFVHAHIRGGSEYGPTWHQAALRENRHRAYEDFVAVAEDLVRRGITRHELVNCMGGSNGGLLVANMYALYPEKFGNIVCMVPLTDMKRFHLLLAGATWMEEYGNPDDPADWEHLRTFSPYHLVNAETDYPDLMFVTSTRDDRVHPAHARKLAARLEDLGKPVVYLENTEGGHGAANTARQQSTMNAAMFTFMWQRFHTARAELS